MCCDTCLQAMGSLPHRAHAVLPVARGWELAKVSFLPGGEVRCHRVKMLDRTGTPNNADPMRAGEPPVLGLSRFSILSPFAIRSFRFQWPADLATSWAFEMETIILGWYVLVETQSV